MSDSDYLKVLLVTVAIVLVILSYFLERLTNIPFFSDEKILLGIILGYCVLVMPVFYIRLYRREKKKAAEENSCKEEEDSAED